jgi:hypothetical protein
MHVSRLLSWIHVRREALSFEWRDPRRCPVAVGRCSWGQPAPRGAGCGWEQPRQSSPAPNLADGPEAVHTCWFGRRPVWWGTSGRSCGCPSGGHGDVLRGSRGEAAGIELGSSSVERTAVNTGTVPVLASCCASGAAVGGDRLVGRSGPDARIHQLPAHGW